MNAPPETRRRVSSVAIELTAHCNQKCHYCYNDWRQDNGASLNNASTEELLGRTRKMLAAWEVDHVTLTGGEPFSRSDIWQLMDLLRDHGVGIQIISNGGMITERIATRLAEYKVMYVQVTLNGATPEMHAEHVGGTGHFEKTLAGIKALQRHGTPVVGCVVVSAHNAPELGSILSLWRSLNVSHIALSRFSPAGYATERAALLLPTLENMQVAFDQAVVFARDGMDISCTMPIPPCMIETADYAPIQFGYCPIGTSMQEFALGPSGTLRNCTLHDTPIGGVSDILKDGVDLSTLLDDAEITQYRSKLPTFCEGCVHADSCGGGCGAAAMWMLDRDKPGDKLKRPVDPFVWQHIDDNFEQRLTREKKDPRRRLQVLT